MLQSLSIFEYINSIIEYVDSGDWFSQRMFDPIPAIADRGESALILSFKPNIYR